MVTKLFYNANFEIYD